MTLISLTDHLSSTKISFRTDYQLLRIKLMRKELALLLASLVEAIDVLDANPEQIYDLEILTLEELINTGMKKSLSGQEKISWKLTRAEAYALFCALNYTEFANRQQTLLARRLVNDLYKQTL
jgi:hypothetical protein